MYRQYSRLPRDEEKLDYLETLEEPGDADKALLSTLISRYAGLPKVKARAIDLALVWGYSPDTLLTECRDTWFRNLNTKHQGGTTDDTTTT